MKAHTLAAAAQIATPIPTTTAPCVATLTTEPADKTWTDTPPTGSRTRLTTAVVLGLQRSASFRLVILAVEALSETVAVLIHLVSTKDESCSKMVQ